jgi:hypothetical protein
MMEQRPEKLLDQVRDAIRLKHYSIRTEEACTIEAQRAKRAERCRLHAQVMGRIPPLLLFRDSSSP